MSGSVREQFYLQQLRLWILRLRSRLRRAGGLKAMLLRIPEELQRGVGLLRLAKYVFIVTLVLCSVILGFALYHRTTNLWQLKNLGDTFMQKQIGRRPIIIGAFHRLAEEQNVRGNFVVFQFVGDSRQAHSLYCYSNDSNGRQLVSRAQIERIHKGKRAANDICAWAGHLAECEVADKLLPSIRVSTSDDDTAPLEVAMEAPFVKTKKDSLVVCIAPMYIYTEWQIMLLGIENWLALGATKIIVPIQSASKNALLLLRQYEKEGVVILRHWPKWPVLSDINPNGLVLSRGIEESHVNCLFYVKPWAKLVVFTDVDDMLIPMNPADIHPSVNVQLLEELAEEHPQAGSFLFEHKDVQLILPRETSATTVDQFNFNFLKDTKWKSSCNVWRMKTRVAVIAKRVDTVNMHETGIHRFGAVQVRVPCRKAHFYHMRHSYSDIAHETAVNMTRLMTVLNRSLQKRVKTTFKDIAKVPLNRSSTESFKDFDRCVMAINEEHWSMKVSRCLTPHVCYSRLTRDIGCLASQGSYTFSHFEGDFVIALAKSEFVESEPNCESPAAKYLSGNYYYMP